MKKIIVLILCTLLVFSFTACENKNQVVLDGYEVVYRGCQAAKDENGKDAMILSYKFTNNSGSAISLAEAVSFEVFQNGFSASETKVKATEGSFEYVDDGKNIRVQNGKTAEIKLTYSVVEFGSFEVVITSLSGKSTASHTGYLKAPEKQDDPPAPPEAKTAVQKYWNGDWFGTWTVLDAGGEYEVLIGRTTDTSVRISLGENGRGTLIMWDEDYGIDEPVMDINVKANTRDYQEGFLSVTDGYFLDYEFENGELEIYPESVADIQHMISISGTYYDPYDDSAFIDYVIFVRPWGMLWDDVYRSDLPTYYSWYLDAVYDNAAMPDEIGGDYIPNSGTMWEAPETFDYDGRGRLTFSYSRDIFYLDEDLGWLSNEDGTVFITFEADTTEKERQSRIDGYSKDADFADYQDYSMDRFRIGSYTAHRATYYNSELQQYVAKTYISFGSDYNVYSGVEIVAYSGESIEHCTSEAVEELIASVRAN